LVTKFATDGDERKSDLVAFAAGAVVGSERHEVEPLLNVAGKTARRLRRAREFWD
jgi:hypothetical protein